MDLLNLPLFQFALPVVAVVACILLVYAFGFKPTETTSVFTKIIEEEDEDKQKHKKSRSKKTVKSNNTTSNDHQPKQAAASPDKQVKQSPIAEIKKVVKKVDKPLDTKVEDTPKKDDKEKEIFDNWTTAVSKKGRKNKPKKESGLDEDDDSVVEIKKVVDDFNLSNKVEKKKEKKAKQMKSEEVLPDTTDHMEANEVEVVATITDVIVDAPVEQANLHAVPLEDTNAVDESSSNVLGQVKKKTKSDKKKKQNQEVDTFVEEVVEQVDVSPVNMSQDTPVEEFAVESNKDVDTSKDVEVSAVTVDDVDANVLSKTSKKKKKNAEAKKNLQSNHVELSSQHHDDDGDGRMIQVMPTTNHQTGDQPVEHEINQDHTNQMVKHQANDEIASSESVKQEQSPQQQSNVETTSNQLSDDLGPDNPATEHSEAWEEAKPMKKKKKVQKI